jgi:DNA-binding beta-propeller fold protein YncE
MSTVHRSFRIATLFALGLAACGDDRAPLDDSAEALQQRAYIVSLASDELTVIDLRRLEIIGRVSTGGVLNHMAELNHDFSKVYVDSPGTSESIVVDARTLDVMGRIPVARHATHASLSRDGRLLAIVGEEENAVSFVDPVTDTEIKRLPGFLVPHFVRFAPDGKYAYVANIGGHHLTRVDLSTLSIDGTIPLDGFDDHTPARDEQGFADAQIDANGILYAAHGETGRVLVYDTNARAKVSELTTGPRPWIVYAEHPFANIRSRLVPNFGDSTVSVIRDLRVQGSMPAGDMESDGVNYSPLAPERAFVMNKLRNDITVVDTETSRVVDRIDVGGTTETASTTADGRWIVATVSSANRVVVIDAKTDQIVKTFDDVGIQPWSVTIPNGQNYCH